MLPKPTPCNQKWLNMTPAEGGRVCGKCEKLIMDFTKTPMREIFRIKMESPTPVCGIYTDKQLKNWGKPESPKRSCSKALLMVTSMFAALQADAKTDRSQAIQTEQLQADHFQFSNNQDTIPVASPDSLNKWTVTGILKDAETMEPLIQGNVLLKGTKTGCVTSWDGAFSLDLSGKVDSMEGVILVFSYVGYNDLEYQIEYQKFQNLELILHPSMIVTDFYARRPNFFERIWWGIKGLFRKKN